MPLLVPPKIPGLSAPTLSRPLGVSCCLGYTTSFVGSLYLFRATRVDGKTTDENGNVLTRDHPSVVKARLAGTAISSVLSVFGVYKLVERNYMPSARVSPGPMLRLSKAKSLTLKDRLLCGLNGN